MEDNLSPENLTPEERFTAIAGLLADGFLRLQPTRLGRLRSTVDSSANRTESTSYHLDGAEDKSVYATVNQS
jgi:hypothetical protein